MYEFRLCGFFLAAEDHGNNNAGGIAGYADFTVITGCKNTGIVTYITYDSSSSRTLKPCLGQIVGYNFGSTISGNTCSGSVDKGKLHTETWTTGALWWTEHHSHDQAMYAQGGEIGFSE